MLSLILASALICQDRPAAKKPPESLVRQRSNPSPAYQAELRLRANKRIWDAAVEHDRWYGTSYTQALVIQEQAEKERQRRITPYYLAKPEKESPVQEQQTAQSPAPWYPNEVTMAGQPLQQVQQTMPTTRPLSYTGAYQNLQPYYWGGGGSPAMNHFFQQTFTRAAGGMVRGVHVPQLHSVGTVHGTTRNHR